MRRNIGHCDGWPETLVVGPFRGHDPRIHRFLDTREWKELRSRAFLKDGNRCVVCGRSAREGAVLNMDQHLAPDIRNLQPACADGNTGKGNWDTADWR
jgi:hypothetical protein